MTGTAMRNSVVETKTARIIVCLPFSMILAMTGRVKMSDFKTKFCEYCNEDSDGYVKPLEKNSHAFIRFGMNGWEISLQAKGWHGECKIRYCPMCGRDLLVK